MEDAEEDLRFVIVAPRNDGALVFKDSEEDFKERPEFIDANTFNDITSTISVAKLTSKIYQTKKRISWFSRFMRGREGDRAYLIRACFLSAPCGYVRRRHMLYQEESLLTLVVWYLRRGHILTSPLIFHTQHLHKVHHDVCVWLMAAQLCGKFQFCPCLFFFPTCLWTQKESPQPHFQAWFSSKSPVLIFLTIKAFPEGLKLVCLTVLIRHQCERSCHEIYRRREVALLVDSCRIPTALDDSPLSSMYVLR